MEASEKSDGLERDFEGIRVLLYFLSFFVCWFSNLCFFFARIALQKNNKKLSDDLGAMKATLQSEYNRAEEVTERAEEDLALARLIRRVADQNLVQAKKTIEDLTSMLAVDMKN
jgi:hypothetical protein